MHVPKAAGTSVNKALYGRTLGHFTAPEIRRRFPKLYDRSFTFSLVRNPWDRVLSAYRFACVGRTETMGVRNPSQYCIPEFKSFESFVCEWLPEQDVEKIDYIFKPQWIFVCNERSELIVDHLGRIEAMDETVAVLTENLGRPILINNENSTRSLKSDFRNAYIRPEMVDIVQGIYKKDINLFDYEFEKASTTI